MSRQPSRVEKLKTMLSFGDKIAVWEEDEDPTANRHREPCVHLVIRTGTIAVDEATPFFFTFDGLRRAGKRLHLHQLDRRHRRLPHDQVREHETGVDAKPPRNINA